MRIVSPLIIPSLFPQQCFQEEKARFKDAEESSVAYLDQIEELTHRESVLQNQIKAMEESKAQQGSKVRQCYNEV